MLVTFDAEADAVYIYFVQPQTIKVSYTIEPSHNIIADYDYQNKLIGLEILNAGDLIGAPNSIKRLEYKDLWEE